MPRHRTLLFRALVGSWLVLGSACAPADDGRLRVTVTVPPLAWLVSEIGGPDVEVEQLVETGEMPETFQPSDQKITRIARSAILFQIGIPAENGPWLRALTASGLRTVDLRDGLTLREIDASCLHVETTSDAHQHDAHRHHEHGHHDDDHHEHGHHGHDEHRPTTEAMDPHVWLSPRRLVTIAATVSRSLGEVDRSHAAEYAARAARVAATLRELDAELRDRLSRVRGRSFLVFHPAWGYFADDYGLRQVAIEIAGQEPTENELTELVRTARRQHLDVLFVQPQTRSATPSSVARALGARLETLDPLAADLPDNLRRVAERLVAALAPHEDDS